MNAISSPVGEAGAVPAHRDPVILGWDVGGAHLKAALLDPQGRVQRVVQLPCTLWTGIEQLHAACDALLDSLPRVPMLHAVTMTGEMADNFPDRPSGVQAIAGVLAERLQRQRGDALRFFAGAAGFVEPAAVPHHLEAIASANWMATAAWCARHAREGILVDVGSTTTDLVPFAGAHPCARGSNDASRLDCGELVYAGIVRTPLMGMAAWVPVAGRWRPAIKEYYATTADVFRVLGELDESCDVQASADNGPKTMQGSARRVLRMIGEDLSPATQASAVALAQWYRERLLGEILAGLHQRLSHGDVGPHAPLVAAGIGRALVDEVARRLHRPVVGIDTLLCAPGADAALRTWAAHCAPAAAVALLAHAGA